MKIVLLPLLLMLFSIDTRQETAPATAEDPAAPKALEIERGFVSAREGWYQDLFGLVHESGGYRTEVLDWTVGHDGLDTVLVGIGSQKESGIRLTLRFRYDGERVVECGATGRWRSDVGIPGSDPDRTFKDISGFVRIDPRHGERRKLACLFAIHGVAARFHADGNAPELVMGGFEIDKPFGDPAEGK